MHRGLATPAHELGRVAIEAALGRSIYDIFVESGEEYFRALETKAVADALASHDGVLALGGGAVLDPGTRASRTSMTTSVLRMVSAASRRAVAMCPGNHWIVMRCV